MASQVIKRDGSRALKKMLSYSLKKHFKNISASD
jgi:hypothetical protein